MFLSFKGRRTIHIAEVSDKKGGRMFCDKTARGTLNLAEPGVSENRP